MDTVDDELRRYEGEPVENEYFEMKWSILHYWQVCNLTVFYSRPNLPQTREHLFPNLFRIAMNVVPVQGSAVSCERVFSSAKRTITDERNRLVAQSIEMKQILKYDLKASSRLSFQARWNTTLAEASACTIAEELERALRSRDGKVLDQLMKELNGS